MNAENENAKGDLKISNEVIAQFAGLEARGCFGIVGIGAMSMRDGFAKVLKNDKLSKGVIVTEKNGALTIDFHVIVAYYVSIRTVAENLMSTVIYRVENFTGMKVDKVNVYVEGVRYID